MSTIEEKFAQVSPLLDDAIQQIDRMEISPQERAAIMALLMSWHLFDGSAEADDRCTVHTRAG